MITKKTVLVLGAGASMDYGFPSGDALMREVYQDCLNPGVNTNFAKAIRDARLTQDMVRQLAASIDATPVRSIDALLEHQTDLIPAGKAAIAARLLPCEKAHVLFDVHKRSESWYQYLWDCIQAPRFEYLTHNELTIITYNYDRSIDFYLRASIKALYKKSDEEIEKVMSRIPIIHLHGQLASLKAVPYGLDISQLDPEQFRSIVDGIKIIHENNHNTEAFTYAKHYMKEADRIIFLGFGFHKTNVERLLDGDIFPKSKFGTAFQCTNAERALLNTRIKGGDLRDLKILPFLRETCLLAD